MIKLDQPNFPVTYLRAFIAMAVDLVVQQTRLPDGQRKVTFISEVIPSREHGYALRDPIVFKQRGVDARGKISGEQVVVNPINPAWRARMEQLNIVVPPSLVTPVMAPSERPEAP